jgi:predicted phosphoribosyltransferase
LIVRKQAIGVPKQNEAAVADLEEFAADVQRSCFVATAIAKRTAHRAKASRRERNESGKCRYIAGNLSSY